MKTARRMPASMLRHAARLIVLLSIVLAAAAWLSGCGAKSDSSAAAGAASGGAATRDSSAAGGTASTPALPPSPIPTEPSLVLGEKVFKQRCVLCHGPDGHGNGPASKGLNPQPRNFHDVAYMKSRTDEQLLTTIHNGKGAMPVWKNVLSEAEMKSALMYVRQFAGRP